MLSLIRVFPEPSCHYVSVCHEMDQFNQIKHVTAGVISDISEIAISYIVQKNQRIILMGEYLFVLKLYITVNNFFSYVWKVSCFLGLNHY